MTKRKIVPLSADLLRTTYDSQKFGFETTGDLPVSGVFLGQKRALDAAEFGVHLRQPGYNIFALGPAGTGKRSIIMSLLEKVAYKKNELKDICYVHNFRDPRRPKALILPPGLGLR